MEKSVNTISKSKFIKLSSRRQHELLSRLARSGLSDLDFDRFLKRYNELHSWTQLDRYIHPFWLSKKEALDEYLNFHLNFTSLQTNQEETGSALSWQPKFEIEVVLDQVRSPYNVGSILRIIDNFGLKGMVHSSPWISLSHPQLIKAARGCEKWIPVRLEKDLISYLENSSLPVIGIENNAPAENLNKDLTYSFFTGKGNLKKDFHILPPDEKTGMNTEEFQIIKLIPKQPHSQVQDVHVWVTKSSLIRRMNLRDLFGTITVLNFSDIEVDKLIGTDEKTLQSLFSFIPPKDTEIIEQ